MISETEDTHPHQSPDPRALGDALRCGLILVADLDLNLQTLEALLLTGPPHAIADAAKAMELSLSVAEAGFQRIVAALETLGAVRLQDAAHQLRRSNEETSAATADSLRRALKRFVRHNDACHRHAQGLARGLSASLRTFHAFGMAGNGRLIAEA